MTSKINVPAHHAASITNAFNNNKSDAQIASLTKLSKGTVSIYRSALGLYRKGGKRTATAPTSQSSPSKAWAKAPQGYVRNPDNGALHRILSTEEVFHALRDLRGLPPQTFKQIRRIELF